ncbi:MAG TPA: carboxypeptidase regulatory-like domain-containing protein, partial [Methanocella sp.]
AIEYKNNKFWFNNVAMGSFPGGLAATSTFYPHIYSTDGITWHAAIYTYTADVAVTAPPTELTLGLKDNTGSLAASPVFFIPLVFESAGESAPVIDPTPTPTPEVLPVSTEPVYDVQQVQDYYNNIYPLLYGPQANYGMTGNATPAAATSFKVSGAVTSAADGSPIAGASVVLGEAKQTTDSLGAFKFEGITTGNNDIAVSADGFASKTQSVNVNADLTQNFALDKVATGGSTVASAANETTNVTTNVTTTTTNTTTNVTTPANTTVAPTTAPSATQTKSPGFEGIIAAIAMIGAAGVLVYVNRKH